MQFGFTAACVFPRFLFALKTCRFPVRHPNYSSWWPVTALTNTSSDLCVAWQACVALLSAETVPLLQSIMALFHTSAQKKLQAPGSFSPLLFLMANHRIYVYMKLAVFLLLLASFVVYIPRGGPFHNGIHMQKKKQSLLIFSAVPPTLCLYQRRVMRKKWLGFMNPDSFK